MSGAEKDRWQAWAHQAQRLGSPLYAQLALAIDGDDALKALPRTHAQAGQPHANLLLAAVHYLLLRGAGHPLRAHYPTVGGRFAGEDVFPLFRDFVRRHEAQVIALVAARVTNTNEVARCCVLRPGFAALAQQESAPLHLIEIGPSAGLNLLWDRYGMRFSREGAVMAKVLPDAPLMLDCELRGTMPPLSPLPRIASRLGLERSPVDLADPEDRDWLRALVWPDQPQRLQRLDAAIGLFRAERPPIRTGDALDLLPALLAAIPRGEAVCVYHSLAVYQFSPAMQRRLTAIMAQAARPVWHLAFEADGGEDYVLTLDRHADGACQHRTLAAAQSHGGWIAWQAA